MTTASAGTGPSATSPAGDRYLDSGLDMARGPIGPHSAPIGPSIRRAVGSQLETGKVRRPQEEARP